MKKFILLALMFISASMCNEKLKAADVPDAMNPDGYIGGLSLGVDYDVSPEHDYVFNSAETETGVTGTPPGFENNAATKDTYSASENSINLSVRAPLTPNFTLVAAMGISNVSDSYKGTGGNTDTAPGYTPASYDATSNGSTEYTFTDYSVGLRWYFKSFGWMRR